MNLEVNRPTRITGCLWIFFTYSNNLTLLTMLPVCHELAIFTDITVVLLLTPTQSTISKFVIDALTF